MRGSDERTGSLFSYVGIEGRLRPDHPLRVVRALTDETLVAMERELAALYVAARFLATLIARPRVKRLLSFDHFSVDGTIIQAWSSMKSVKPIGLGEGPGDQPPPSAGRNAEAELHGETRSNATHASTTDPEVSLYNKSAGTEARRAFLGHALMENRAGLVVDDCLTRANGHAERLAKLAMIEKHADRPRAITLGADKGEPVPGLDSVIRPTSRTCCAR